MSWLVVALLVGCQEANPAAGETVERAGAGRIPESLSAVGEAGKLRFALRFEPRSPGVGELFRVTTTVHDLRTGRPVEGGALRLDATMPDHGHGMATHPRHRALGGGRFLSEGMKLHMPGLWHLRAEVVADADAAGRIEDYAVIAYEQPVAGE